MSEGQAQKYGFIQDQGYPDRMIVHQFARQRALDVYKSASQK
jgi:hypothetical protein